MAYITLDELKECLPIILSDWIEPGDEGWEWIFQEIEQKCHIGKKKKDKKKKWKKKLREDVDELQYFRHNEYEVKVNGIATKINQLNKEVEEMHRKQIDMCLSMDRMRNNISAAESKAKIAMIRTEIDYSDYSGKKHEDQIIQNVYNRMLNRGATLEELESFRDVIKKYDATNVRPMTVNPNDKTSVKPEITYRQWDVCRKIIKTCEKNGATKEEIEQLDLIMSKYIPNPIYKEFYNGIKDCSTCKYYCGEDIIRDPCTGCKEHDCWEAE